MPKKELTKCLDKLHEYCIDDVDDILYIIDYFKHGDRLKLVGRLLSNYRYKEGTEFRFVEEAFAFSRNVGALKDKIHHLYLGSSGAINE